MHTHRSNTRWRLVRAYWTTLVVLWSYAWLKCASLLWGEGYWERHIDRLHTRNALRVQATLLKLEGLFIKFGQLLSLIPNLLPLPFRTLLEELQDNVPPRPFAEITETIERELGKPCAELFAELKPTPLASASLGQVHEAYLHDGTHVVVKVQHLNIETLFRLDLEIIRRIMEWIRWLYPIAGIDAYYHQVKSLLERELDFVLEVSSLERIAHQFALQPSRVVFPTPVRSLCTHRVLVSTFMPGAKISDLAYLATHKLNPTEVAKRLLGVYCEMIFVHGTYHADPHPGNLLVQEGGALVLLDFGAVAELSLRMREGIASFLEGLLRHDTPQLLKALRTMGFLARTRNPRLGEKVIEYVHERFQEAIAQQGNPTAQTDPLHPLEELFALKEVNIGLQELSQAFVIPKEWIVLERTLLLLYGTCAGLDPRMNPFEVVEPYLRKFLQAHKDWKQVIFAAAKSTTLSTLALPQEIRQYLAQAVRGEQAIQIVGLEKSAQLVSTALRQLMYAMLTLGAGGTAWALHREHHPTLSAVSGGGAALLLLLCLSRRTPPPSR